MVKNSKWYQKSWGIVLLLILFFPVGIYLMWKYTTWGKNIKIGITVFVLIFSVMVYATNPKSSNPNLSANQDLLTEPNIQETISDDVSESEPPTSESAPEAPTASSEPESEPAQEEPTSSSEPESELPTSALAPEEATSSSEPESKPPTSEPTPEEPASSSEPESKPPTSEPTLEEPASSSEPESEPPASEPAPEEPTSSSEPENDPVDYQITGNSSYVFRRNEDATISITAAPNTEYNISVHYSSGESTAEGLHNKTTDSNGNVSWTWHIGGRTKHGTYNAYVSGNGERFEISFEVVD